MVKTKRSFYDAARDFLANMQQDEATDYETEGKMWTDAERIDYFKYFLATREEPDDNEKEMQELVENVQDWSIEV